MNSTDAREVNAAFDTILDVLDYFYGFSSSNEKEDLTSMITDVEALQKKLQSYL